MNRLLYNLSLLALICFPFHRTIAAEFVTPGNLKSEEIIRDTIPQIKSQFSRKGLTLGSPIFIRIFKESGQLELWVKNGHKYKFFKTYYICDISGTLGPKIEEGDEQGPEGFYRVGVDQLNPWSKHHLSFNLGFPNDYDMAYQRTGNALMVHGKCTSSGCFAMSNFRIDEIYTIADSALRFGQGSFPVHIFPFRMTEQNLKSHQGRWSGFWKNLKEGYDIFQETSLPPSVLVKNCRYIFSLDEYLTASANVQDEPVCTDY